MNPEDIDPRVTCTACRHLEAGWCTNAVQAHLHPNRQRQEVGRMLAGLKQWCGGFQAKASA